MEFSTLMFLKEIQKSKLRRIRIKQLLLLIFRIIIIILLVLAFSNPIYKGYLFGTDPDIRKCGIFIFDNSFSMSVKDENGSYFEQAKSSLQNILKLYNTNDKIFLITSSHLKSFEKGESKDIPDLIDSLKNLELTSVPFDLPFLFNYAKDIIKNQNFPLYEVFVISDFQKINLQSKNVDKDLFKDLNNNIYFYNLEIGKREANNISLEKAKIETKILENNKDIKLSVVLKNHNKFNALNKQINLFVDDKKVGETVVDLVSLERKEIYFSFKPLKSGSSAGFVELVQDDFFEDEINQDNKYYFSFYIPEDIKIGMIGNNELNFKYVKLAIESAEKINDNDGKERFYNISYLNNITDELFKTDMGIITGKISFSENEIKLLSEYIQQGKGILVFPSRNSDIKSYNELLRSLNAFKIDDISKYNFDTLVNNKFQRIDFEHPIFYGVFKNQELTISSDRYFVESPKINFIYNIIPNENSVGLLLLADSKIFLVESNSGDGKLIFSAVSGDEEMSDFPKKSIFPLIINKSIFYLSNGEYLYQNNIVGKTNVIFFNKKKTLSINYNETYKEPGIYSITFPPNYDKNYFTLNRDSTESDIRKSEKDDLKEFYANYNLKNVEFINQQSDFNQVIQKSRNGFELWKTSIIFALIFVIIEMIYSKKLEKK